MYAKAGPILCLSQVEYDEAVKAGAKDDPAKVVSEPAKPADVKPEKKGK